MLHPVESLDLGILVTLDALLAEGNVTRAARRVGLSTPAMSHALARIRDKIGDPILVRAGRGMVLTPRAEAMKPRVHALVEDAREVLRPERRFSPAELQRAFLIHATDHVLTLLGLALDASCRAEAPGVSLRFSPNSTEDAALLREGLIDLAVGIYGELPPEVQTRQLLTDRFVCVVREGHPTVEKRLGLEQFVRLPHVQVAPRGRPGGYIDDMLAARGKERHVARAVPYFLVALQLVAETDYILTISERIARAYAPRLGLRILAPPLPLRPYALSLIWHPRRGADPAHAWLRDLFVRAAKTVAADVHDAPRTRLDATDPTNQSPRKRARRARG